MPSGSDHYFERAFAFMAEVSARSGQQDVAKLITLELERLGFEYVTIWPLPSPGQPVASGVMLNTRPIDYIQRYVEEDLVKIDPAIAELRFTSRPYSLSDIRRRRKLSRKAIAVMDEATDFGIHDGMVVPISTLSGSFALVSPCGKDPDLSQRARSLVEVIGIVGHQALKRAAHDTLDNKIGQQRLTPREREVMYWLAQGLNDDEIGDKLHISTGTVTVHCENAKRKLGVNKRSAAVYQAIKRGELIP